jgi:hypothetical protein
MPKKRKPATPRRPAPKPLPEPLPPNPLPIPVRVTSTILAHLFEVRPRKDKRGVDLISDALPFGRSWYGEPNAVSNALGYGWIATSISFLAATSVFGSQRDS